MAEQIRVLIVEDHQSTLDGLMLGLARESDIELIGSSTNSGEALKLAESLKPDAILLDLHVPGSLGPRSMVEQFCQFPAIKLIVFSAENRMAFIQSVMSLGVSAYLLKSERVATVAEVLRAVMGGKKGILSPELTAGYKRFTPSEQEVLDMLGCGMKYQDIADRRATTVATVRKQCETLLLKLGLESREQLIAWAVKNGYGSLEIEA